MIDRDFIIRWDEAVTADIDSQLPDNVPPHLAERRSVLRDPADEAAIAEAERRLGVELPPSYRQFLRQTNGAFANGLGMVFGSGWDADGDLAEQGIGFLPVEGLQPGPPDMYREWAERDLEGAVDPNYRAPYTSEWEYLDHDRKQDPSFFKTGHDRHCLSISTDRDGDEVLLNPLVTQPDGEWEAWDFGAKTPGTYRYPSFQALLQRHIDRPPIYGYSPQVDVEPAIRTLDQDDATIEDRRQAIHQLWLSGLGRDEHPRWRTEALALALDPAADRSVRINQARMLAWKLDVEGLRQLLGDPEPSVWRNAIAPLVASSDPAARDVAYDALITKPVDHTTVAGLHRDPTGVLWDAYLETGNQFLLAAGARSGNIAAQREALEVYVDGRARKAAASDLAIALSRTSAELADDVAAAASRPDAPVEVLGPLLARIAPKQAVPVLRRVFDDSKLRSNVPDAAHHLGRIRTSEARDALIAALAADVAHPAAVITALARHPHPDAVQAVVARASDPDLLLDVIYTLEHQAIEEARDELAHLDHIQAWRALARLGDDRSLGPLLDASGSADVEVRREALDGLRDLAHPDAADRLLEVLAAADPESDEAAICAHALATMRHADAPAVLGDLLGRSTNSHMQRVVTHFLEALGQG